MRIILHVLTLTALLATAPNRSFALESFSPVTCKEAKALGMTFRAQKAGGPNAVRVEVTFEAKGKLEGVKKVTLRMYDGEKLLVFTTLSNEAEAAGRFKASFMIDRDLLDKSKLWISSSLGGASVGGAYVLNVSDIDEVKGLR
ncbi:hypothetical protein [Zavarzinella formosa]|uniref:hypothetical protein n=1 Tax=Zavarzinella formosa TaxID=360055 RepID=UPI0012FAC3B8|nr:hypothetical protein [Zavarzinella formosa]